MKCELCGTMEEHRFGKDKYRCLTCNCTRAKRTYAKNPGKYRSYALTRYHKNRDVLLLRNKEYEKTVKKSVFIHYGGFICACCGETRRPFLTIDHINGGGSKARKESGGGGKFTYRWIVRNNYPPGFRVLCYNCNSGRAQNGGVCPHEEERNKMNEHSNHDGDTHYAEWYNDDTSKRI